jgi:exodeoxyribonuclease III
VPSRPPESAAKRAARLERRRAALAARPAMSPVGPAADRLRVATWNLNSLRARLPAVARFLERVAPDVLCLQETKAGEVSEAAAAVFEERGYQSVHIGSGAYNGVGIVARAGIDQVVASGGFGDEALDREPRVISGVVALPAPVRYVSVYVPHGRAVDHWHYEYKLAFVSGLAARVRAWRAAGERVVLAGDLNIAATDSDVFHPDAFVGSTHVTPAERDALAGLYGEGLVDVDVARWGARARRFTWWNHGIGYSRNLGMRLDVIAVDDVLAPRLDTTWIDHVERGAERPSDHAALIADLHLEGL